MEQDDHRARPLAAAAGMMWPHLATKTEPSHREGVIFLNPDGGVCAASPCHTQAPIDQPRNASEERPHVRRRRMLLDSYPSFAAVESDMYPILKAWQRWFWHQEHPDTMVHPKLRMYRAAKYAVTQRHRYTTTTQRQRSVPEAYELALAWYWLLLKNPDITVVFSADSDLHDLTPHNHTRHSASCVSNAVTKLF
jgi:hypothetical protein